LASKRSAASSWSSDNLGYPMQYGWTRPRGVLFRAYAIMIHWATPPSCRISIYPSQVTVKEPELAKKLAHLSTPSSAPGAGHLATETAGFRAFNPTKAGILHDRFRVREYSGEFRWVTNPNRPRRI
jgi:hypothetical protein